MSRLIDADDPKLRGKLKFIREAEGQIYGRASWCFSAKCEAAIDETQTVDAISVVRCKNCEHREFYGPYLFCERHRMNVDTDFYCGDGIREDDSDD